MGVSEKSIVVGGAKDVEGLSAEEMFKIFDTDNDGKIGTADFSLLHKHIVKHLLGERNESRKKKALMMIAFVLLVFLCVSIGANGAVVFYIVADSVATKVVNGTLRTKETTNSPVATRNMHTRVDSIHLRDCIAPTNEVVQQNVEQCLNVTGRRRRLSGTHIGDGTEMNIHMADVSCNDVVAALDQLHSGDTSVDAVLPLHGGADAETHIAVRMDRATSFANDNMIAIHDIYSTAYESLVYDVECNFTREKCSSVSPQACSIIEISSQSWQSKHVVPNSSSRQLDSGTLAHMDTYGDVVTHRNDRDDCHLKWINGGNQNGNTDDGYWEETCHNACFSAQSTHACKVVSSIIPASTAHSLCFDRSGGAITGNSTELVHLLPMTELGAGDTVLSMDMNGRLVFDHVLVNMHMHDQRKAQMVHLHHSNGTVSMTLDHMLWLCGRGLVAAGEVRMWDLIMGNGHCYAIHAIEYSNEDIINPITLSGFILATDKGGQPVLSSVISRGSMKYLLASNYRFFQGTFIGALSLLLPQTAQRILPHLFSFPFVNIFEHMVNIFSGTQFMFLFDATACAIFMSTFFFGAFLVFAITQLYSSNVVNFAPIRKCCA
mmetsp:Transcript_36886/g.73573  ORF Transcript_36886/g.73573 Transcript_36886/m.73573 type:complete len:604 (-) Transcript_36886:481-2292(-)